MPHVLDPKAVKDALSALLNDVVECEWVDEELQLDTPFTLQDGHLFRAYLTPSSTSGGFTATDGGYAMSQVELFVRSPAAQRERREELKRIANRLHMNWDGEFSYTEQDLESAVRRVAVLARAVDMSLSLLHARARRSQVPFRKQLSLGFRQAGLTVQPGARIVTSGESSVTVDYEVRRNGTRAAVELLTAQTVSGAFISVDHIIGNFHTLARGAYPGLLFAVYGEDSPGGNPQIRQRFKDASPDRAELLSQEDAVSEIVERLHARVPAR